MTSGLLGGRNIGLWRVSKKVKQLVSVSYLAGKAVNLHFQFFRLEECNRQLVFVLLSNNLFGERLT